jgi:hypothetical protein
VKKITMPKKPSKKTYRPVSFPNEKRPLEKLIALLEKFTLQPQARFATISLWL